MKVPQGCVLILFFFLLPLSFFLGPHVNDDKNPYDYGMRPVTIQLRSESTMINCRRLPYKTSRKPHNQAAFQRYNQTNDDTKNTSFKASWFLLTRPMKHYGKMLKIEYKKGHDPNPWFSGITFFLD